MVDDPSWDFQNPASKDRLLTVLGAEIDAMFELVADPARWHTPTACPGWEVRDMVGHLMDATDGYLTAFDMAHTGTAAPDPVGLAGMAAATDRAARAFRSVPRDELVTRLRDGTRRLIQEFETLSDADWSGLIVPDPYLGPLPAMIIAAGLLGGYTVHGWDIREGFGAPHALTGDAVDLLVPFVFLLWWATADTASVDEPYAIGIRTTGRNGGETRFHVAQDGLQFAAATIDTCPAVLEFDPATLILTAYNRINGGTVRGDRQVAANFRALFVAI
jgi:uncharacterized protein (TIGR03083 family)